MGFRTDFAKAIKACNGSASTLARRMMLDLDARVVKRTPVDTGRAKGNWIPAVGSPSTEARETTSPTNAASVFNSIPEFPVLYLSNNLPYIEKLENGHSDQAPQGMAKLSVLEVAKKYK